MKITQRERITILESKLSEQGGHVEYDIAQLQNYLLLAKESEAAQKNKIESLEANLRKAVDRSQISAFRCEINVWKEKLEKMRALERERRKNIETRLELVNDEDPNISSLRDQIAKLKASESDARRTVQEYESKLAAAQKEVKIFDTVKEEVRFLKELEIEQKSTIEQLQAQLHKLRTYKEVVVNELQTMKGGFNLQKDLVISLEKEVNSLREKLAEIKDNDTKSSQDIKGMTNLISKTQKERDDTQKIIRALEIEIVAGVAGNEDVITLRSELANAKLEIAAQMRFWRILMNLNSELSAAKDSSNVNKKQFQHSKKNFQFCVYNYMMLRLRMKDVQILLMSWKIN